MFGRPFNTLHRGRLAWINAGGTLGKSGTVKLCAAESPEKNISVHAASERRSGINEAWKIGRQMPGSSSIYQSKKKKKKRALRQGQPSPSSQSKSASLRAVERESWAALFLFSFFFFSTQKAARGHWLNKQPSNARTRILFLILKKNKNKWMKQVAPFRHRSHLCPLGQTSTFQTLMDGPIFSLWFMTLFIRLIRLKVAIVRMLQWPHTLDVMDVLILCWSSSSRQSSHLRQKGPTAAAGMPSVHQTNPIDRRIPTDSSSSSFFFKKNSTTMRYEAERVGGPTAAQSGQGSGGARRFTLHQIE